MVFFHKKKNNFSFIIVNYRLPFQNLKQEEVKLTPELEQKNFLSTIILL